MSQVMRLCARCERKITEHYYTVEVMGSATERGTCAMCGRTGYFACFEFSPRRAVYKRRTGGGERQRAGGGSR